jgi:mannose-6-phosphate isomerase-like protein (cupin superfamily)
MAFSVRRIVTGIDAHGQAVFVSDGPPPRLIEAPTGTAVADLWNLFAPPTDPSDGGDPPAGPFELEPKPGGLWWRLIRMPLPDSSLPREQQFLAPSNDNRFSKEERGMHRTDSVDLMLVVDGRIELEVDHGVRELGAGDCVVQRGTMHRWRVVGDRPCTYLTAMLATDPTASAPTIDLAPRPTVVATGQAPRRVVTGVDPLGRSIVLTDGEAPTSVVFEHGAGMMYSALWESGGAIASPLQGGDPPVSYLQLDPLGMGVSWKYLVLPSDSARRGIDGPKLRAEMQALASGMAATGHHDPNDPANHRTDTIDLDYILEGDVELELPGHGSVRLGPGDCVVQRGNWHKWHNRGDTPMRMLAILVGAPIGGRR